MIRKHMKISGRVQGVGFRYHTQHAASSLGITGWVRNEWDGTVELEAQGSEAQINQMLTLVNQGMFISIDEIKSKEIPLEEHENGFHVRYTSYT